MRILNLFSSHPAEVEGSVSLFYIYLETNFLVKRLYIIKVFVTVFLMIKYLRVTVFDLFKDLSQVFMRLT